MIKSNCTGPSAACQAVLFSPELFAEVARFVPPSHQGELRATCKAFAVLCASGTPKNWAAQVAPAVIDTDTCTVTTLRTPDPRRVAAALPAYRGKRVQKPLGMCNGQAWQLRATRGDIGIDSRHTNPVFARAALRMGQLALAYERLEIERYQQAFLVEASQYSLYGMRLLLSEPIETLQILQPDVAAIKRRSAICAAVLTGLMLGAGAAVTLDQLQHPATAVGGVLGAFAALTVGHYAAIGILPALRMRRALPAVIEELKAIHTEVHAELTQMQGGEFI